MPSAIAPAAWTPERLSQALRLYLLEGLTASAVAEALGGTSRAALIAKLRRLGHLKRGPAATGDAVAPTPRVRRVRSAMSRIQATGRRFPPQPPPLPLPPLREAAATGTPTTLARLPFAACRWPIDDPGPGRMHLALFCAGPTTDGRYCAAHRAIASRSRNHQGRNGDPP